MGLTDLMSMAQPNLETRENVLSRLGNRELVNCFQCLKCTSGCTALKLLELKPHEIVKFVNLGFIDELASSDIIWTCATCLKCIQRCPQKASPYHTIMALQNLAVKKDKKIPEGYLKAVSQILETGLAETEQRVVTEKMETFDRKALKLPKIDSPRENLQMILMKIMEEQ